MQRWLLPVVVLLQGQREGFGASLLPSPLSFGRNPAAVLCGGLVLRAFWGKRAVRGRILSLQLSAKSQMLARSVTYQLLQPCGYTLYLLSSLN